MPDHEKRKRSDIDHLLNPHNPGHFKDFGFTPMAIQPGLTPEKTNGHCAAATRASGLATHWQCNAWFVGYGRLSD